MSKLPREIETQRCNRSEFRVRPHFSFGNEIAASGPQEVLAFPGGIREIGNSQRKRIQSELRGYLMNKSQKILGAVILLLLGLSLYAFWISQESENAKAARAARKSAGSNKSLVDQSPLKMAQQVTQLATSRSEGTLAREALRLADYEVDLTFDAVLRDALLHPPPLSPEAKEISEELVKVPESKQEAVGVRLIQAQADMELDQDELDDAKVDFARAGGDLADRIQALRKEHEDSAHNAGAGIPTSPAQPGQFGLIH